MPAQEAPIICHFAGGFGMYGRCPVCREYRAEIHCGGPNASSACPACCVKLPSSGRNVNCVIDTRDAAIKAGRTGHLPYYQVSPQGARLALRLPL